MAAWHKKSYWVFSVAVFALWGIIFLVHWLVGSPPHLPTLGLIFFGYVIGWLLATVAAKRYR